MKFHLNTLDRMNLPRDLIALIHSGQLLQEVERAQRDTALLNEQLDAFEAEHPETAALLPWYDARQQWKADGRPEAPWWELLKRRAKKVPISDLEMWAVVPEMEYELYHRRKLNPEKHAKYKAQRLESARVRGAERRQRAREMRAKTEK